MAGRTGTGDGAQPRRATGARQWLGLAVLVAPSTLLFTMLTMLFLSAPGTAADLDPTSSQLLCGSSTSTGS